MTVSVSNLTTQIGGTARTFSWVWQNQPYRIAYEVRGNGLPLLLLPSFSTVSAVWKWVVVGEQASPQSKAEMEALAALPNVVGFLAPTPPLIKLLLGSTEVQSAVSR